MSPSHYGGNLSSTSLQPNQHPPDGYSQIPGATSQQETYVAMPHLNPTETPGPKDQRTVLDHRQTIPSIAEQQTTTLQGNIETGMDLWNRTVGVCFTIKYSKNPALPVQTFKTYNGRTMVRWKPNYPPRPLR
jgi:hypothetical protein